MITKRARLQFDTLLAAAEAHSLCVAKCYNIKTGKPEYVVCAHRVENGTEDYFPIAKMFASNPLGEITPPGASKYKLI